MKKSVVAVVVTLLSATAFAQSVKEKKAWDKIDEESKAAAKYIKEKCGADVSITPDKKSWNTVELAEGPARWCISEAQSALGSLCDDADYKAAVAKNVKKITCVMDAKLPNTGSADLYGNKLSLKGGTVEWRYHKDSSNLGDNITKFLKENL